MTASQPVLELVLATGNRGKLREIGQILADLPVRVRALSEFPDVGEIVEDGETFRANAELKARAVHAHTGFLAVADDSGLCVDHLSGAPGVRSARYAGERATDAENNRKLLAAMEGVPARDRGATFVCRVCAFPVNGEPVFLEGECRGVLLTAPRGDNGFGYDPVFLYPPENQTFAELPPAIKNRISHRGRAFAGLPEVLRRLIADQVRDPKA
jgi:XTP/dITP diphosphohydrolase